MSDDPVTTELLKRATTDDARLRLSCHRAHVLCEGLGVSPALVGQRCQELGIKITDCQLGCFGRRT